jgi:oligoendopeptidase F
MFGNLVGTIRDMTTMIHESGHAIHGRMMHNTLPLNAFSEVPMEIAEIGSMALELLSMDSWETFGLSDEQLIDAKQKHMEDIIDFFPMCSCIDQFQHWLYRNPGHSHEQRGQAWQDIFQTYKGNLVSYE